MADRTSVFNMIVSFTTGQPSGDWIKSTLRYSDKSQSMEYLRRHFSGEGNATRNLAEAEKMQESMHYKGKRAMALETFLTQCQKMPSKGFHRSPPIRIPQCRFNPIT